jgi:hypothetical protein
MRNANVRLWLPREDWARFKVEARREKVPATTLLSLMVRSWNRKPWRFELIPRERTPEAIGSPQANDPPRGRVLP